VRASNYRELTNVSCREPVLIGTSARQGGARSRIRRVTTAELLLRLCALLFFSASVYGQNPPTQDVRSTRDDQSRTQPVVASVQVSSDTERNQTEPRSKPSDAGSYAEAKRLLEAKDYAASLPLLEKVADAGKPTAMHDLGELYYYGRGVTQDYAKARAWYQRAAEAGNALAMADLAYLYEHGFGISQDYVWAFVWYKRAAEAGDADAMYNLGILYSEGQGIPQDYAQARKWFQRAASTGQVFAMQSLGRLYANGLGVAQDDSKASQWYQRAAEEMYSLGLGYAEGQGVAQDYAQAREWYQKAAEAGHAGAMNNLACLYQQGRGGAQDYAEARDWFQKAANAGSPEATQNLKLMDSADSFVDTVDRVARILFWISLLAVGIVIFVAATKSSRKPVTYDAPGRVQFALLLLWTSLTVAALRLVLTSFIDQSRGAGIACLICAVGLGLHAILLRFVGRGSKRARIILMVLLLLAIPLAPILVQIGAKSVQNAAFIIIDLAARTVATFLLFSGGAGQWFENRGGKLPYSSFSPRPAQGHG